MIKIEEDGVPINTTAGIEGPKSPIKFQTVSKNVFTRATKLKKKLQVKEALNIDADLLLCTDTNESLFLEN